MAEIKSTLDLVMEKTRHLSMNEEEKQEKRREEVVGRVQGLLQKLQDKTIKLSEVEKELDSIKAAGNNDHVDPNETLRRELISRLDFEQDNTVLLRLLETHFGVNTDPLHELFDQYRKDLDTARQDRLNELRHDLAAREMISGSAVIPNPAADPEWQQKISDVKTSYARKLTQLANKAA